MIAWIRRLFGFDDEIYTPNMSHGRCEAVVAHCMFTGIPVTCGRRTNKQEFGYWTCSKHPAAKALHVTPKP